MRIAKTFQDGTGFLTNLLKPGEGKTGLAGYASSALGFMGENKLRKMPELEAQALGVDVDSKQRLLERAAVMPEISRTSALLTQLGQMDALQNQQNATQKALTDAAFANLEASQVAKDQFDILGQPQADADAMFAFGTQFSNLEGLINPQAAATTETTKKTRGEKLAERGYKHGGITPGPHDHDVLNLIISHEDGTPALDSDGDEMHVTGSEAIIPDYIFEELMAAAKAGDKNALFEIFMDEIATEERFQV